MGTCVCVVILFLFNLNVNSVHVIQTSYSNDIYILSLLCCFHIVHYLLSCEDTGCTLQVEELLLIIMKCINVCNKIVKRKLKMCCTMSTFDVHETNIWDLKTKQIEMCYYLYLVPFS